MAPGALQQHSQRAWSRRSTGMARLPLQEAVGLVPAARQLAEGRVEIAGLAPADGAGHAELEGLHAGRDRIETLRGDLERPRAPGTPWLQCAQPGQKGGRELGVGTALAQRPERVAVEHLEPARLQPGEVEAQAPTHSSDGIGWGTPLQVLAEKLQGNGPDRRVRGIEAVEPDALDVGRKDGASVFGKQRVEVLSLVVYEGPPHVELGDFDPGQAPEVLRWVLEHPPLVTVEVGAEGEGERGQRLRSQRMQRFDPEVRGAVGLAPDSRGSVQRMGAVGLGNDREHLEPHGHSCSRIGAGQASTAGPWAANKATAIRSIPNATQALWAVSPLAVRIPKGAPKWSRWQLAESTAVSGAPSKIGVIPSILSDSARCWAASAVPRRPKNGSLAGTAVIWSPSWLNSSKPAARPRSRWKRAPAWSPTKTTSCIWNACWRDGSSVGS